MTEKNVQPNNREKSDEFSMLEFSKQNSDKKKRRLKSAALLIFNVLVIAAIIIIELTTNNERVDIGNVLITWGDNWIFLISLLALVVGYYLFLTLKINVLIRSTTGRSRHKLAFSTAVLGKYYDNITPFGSGGQPFQMFNLGRKLDVGHATAIPIADFIINQLVFVIISVVVFIVNPGSLGDNTFLQVAAYIGLVFYAFIPVVVIVFSFFPRVITAIAKFFCKLGHKLHLIKDLEKTEHKVTDAVQRYSSSLKLVSKNWGYLIISFVFSAIAWWILASMPYMVLRVCGVEADYFDAVCMCFFVYAAITVVPTPGNAGAAEGAFYVIFKSLSGGYLFWGTMLWRFCVYYFSLISGFSVTIYQYIHAARKEKRHAKQMAAEGVSAPPAQNESQGGETSADKNEELSDESGGE